MCTFLEPLFLQDSANDVGGGGVSGGVSDGVAKLNVILIITICLI